MGKHIATKEGLQELLRRYQEAGADVMWLNTIQFCIIENLAMDEVIYKKSPTKLRKLWEGLQ